MFADTPVQVKYQQSLTNFALTPSNHALYRKVQENLAAARRALADEEWADDYEGQLAVPTPFDVGVLRILGSVPKEGGVGHFTEHLKASFQKAGLLALLASPSPATKTTSSRVTKSNYRAHLRTMTKAQWTALG